MADLPPKNLQPTGPTNGPKNNAIQITPNDDSYIGEGDHGIVIERLYIGNPGDLVVVTVGDQTVTYKNVQGYLSGIRVVKVLETGTTAFDIVGEY